MSKIKSPPPIQEMGIEDQATVRQWSENVQQIHGDSLVENVISQFKDVSFPESQLEAVKQAWEKLTVDRKAKFTSKYGYLAQLMYVQVNYSVLKALIRHWDPAYRCFTFGSIDMTPTIEEYQSLLHMPTRTEVEAYSYDQELTMKRALSTLLGKIRTSDIEKQVKIKGENTCLPLDYILTLQQKFANEDKELTLLALCIFNVVLFPKVCGYVEERVVKLFAKIEIGVDPIIPVLAETFRSLNYCRTKGTGRFIGCAPLLYIWVLSHVKCPPEFKCPEIKFSSSWNKLQNPISEFVQSGWSSSSPERSAWEAFFSELKIEDVIWRAPWMSTRPMIYKCGKFQSLPLLGPWGCISYAPLLVVRQIWVRQFIPATHELKDFEFAYDKGFCKDRIQKIVRAWKMITKIQSGQFHDDTTEAYKTWHANRAKTVLVSPKMKTKIKLNAKVIPDQQTEQAAREKECDELRKANSSLVQENERLQLEVKQGLLRNVELEKELNRLKGSVSKQEQLEKEISALDTEARDLNRRMHRLRRDNEVSQATLKSRNDQVLKQQSEIASLHELMKELEDCISLRNQTITEVEEKNGTLCRTIDDLQLTLKIREDQLGDLINDNKGLRESVQSLNVRLGKYQDATDRLMKDYTYLKEQYDRLSDDFGFARQNHATLRSKAEHMLTQIRRVTRRAD
ncbi:hypothetical protein NP118_23375, partial [Salmonella enterica]|nr:hypothetical protein [Salmonella enterica]